MAMSLALTSCSYVFAQPSVVYKTDDTIGVTYCATNSYDCWGDGTEAMEIVSKYCNDKYTVTNRDSSGGSTTIEPKSED